MTALAIGLALGLTGLWLYEQRRRRQAERETNILLLELRDGHYREQSFRADRVELIETINQLRERGGDIAVVFPPGYLSGAEAGIDIRA